MKTCVKTERGKTMRHMNLLKAGASLLLSIGLIGCATQNISPLTEMVIVDIQGKPVPGIRLLQTDGVSYAGTYRAEHGVVVCSHFDIAALEQAGVAAASAMNWKINGLKGELDAPIMKVNGLAAAKGVKPGMKVREALALMNQ